MQPKGIITAMVTPTDEAGKVNESSLRNLTNYLIDRGVHGLFPVGSQGEFWAFTPEEKRRIIEVVVDEARGRVPVYAGTGAITTQQAVELAKIAKSAGAAAISVLTPFYIKPNEDELFEHYKAIAEAVPDVPVLLYGNRDRTGIGLSPDFVARCNRIDNVVGIKDSSGDMTVAAEYIRRTQGAKEFSVLAGRDTLIYGFLCYGGKGAIAATSNVAPKLVVEIYEAFMAGDMKRSLEAQFRLAPLRIAFELGTFPAVIKEALNLLGMDAGPSVRPVGPLPEAKRAELKRVLTGLGLRVAPGAQA
ncbi:MAG: 4-hydroxy-tetrahydrodipicolinate synthase [Bacillota bacterium]